MSGDVRCVLADPLHSHFILITSQKWYKHFIPLDPLNSFWDQSEPIVAFKSSLIPDYLRTNLNFDALVLRLTLLDGLEVLVHFALFGYTRALCDLAEAPICSKFSVLSYITCMKMYFSGNTNHLLSGKVSWEKNNRHWKMNNFRKSSVHGRTGAASLRLVYLGSFRSQLSVLVFLFSPQVKNKL